MLLAFALEAERVQGLDDDNDALRYAVTLAAYHLESAREGGRVSFGSGANEAALTVVTPEDVAHRLSTVPLHDVTPTGLRSALTDAVDSARYWQDPEGEDVLTTTEPVRCELRRIAEHIARSPHTHWWTAGPAGTEQWALWTWGDDRPDPPTPPASTAAERLRFWREETTEAEERAARDRPTDPSANYSAEWWSTPLARSSTRQLPDGTPAELWFVEDSMGWERAVMRRVSIPAGARVYEVDSAQAWAELCRRFPVEVTAQKRHDWYRTTGRSGRWVVPDWTRIADEYAGVHLTVAGYLAAAGTAIDVDADTASVIAGWTPDVTYWLTDIADVNGEFRTWLCDTTGRHLAWVDEAHRLQ
ncbi:hypothetical protein ACWF62_13620 [Rhodococcus sp. NPDC054953]